MRPWKLSRRGPDLPVILFPSSVAGLCENADAVFFMSLLNSRSTSYIVENQAMGAPLVLRYGLEPIPMAYIIIEPGGTVGCVGDAGSYPEGSRSWRGLCPGGQVHGHEAGLPGGRIRSRFAGAGGHGEPW